MTIRSGLALTAIALALSGCGGGGGASTVPAMPSAQSAPTAPQGSTRGVATITIPARSSSTSAGKRSTKWISPSTYSLVITTTPQTPTSAGTGTSTIVPVTPTSSNCTTLQSGGRQCSVPFPAVPGTDEVTIYAYDASDPARATPLAAIDQRGVPFAAGVDNSMSFVLGGIIGRAFTFTPQPSATLTAANGPQTVTVPLVVMDYDGNPIGAKLDAPLCVLLTNPGGKFSLTTPAAGAPICAMPAAPAGVPQGTGVAISDLSQLSALAVHYSGGGADTASLTIATTSMDSFTLLSTSIYQTITLTAQ